MEDASVVLSAFQGVTNVKAERPEDFLRFGGIGFSSYCRMGVSIGSQKIQQGFQRKVRLSVTSGRSQIMVVHQPSQVPPGFKVQLENSGSLPPKITPLVISPPPSTNAMSPSKNEPSLSDSLIAIIYKETYIFPWSGR